MRTLRTNRGARRRGAGTLPGLLALCVLILYPLLTLLLQTFMPHLFDLHPSGQLSLKPMIGVFEDKDNSVAILNSFLLGVCAAVVAMVLGTLSAFAAHRAPGRVGTCIRTLVWIVFMAPSYVIAEGWLLLMMDGGILAQIFHLPNGWSGFFFSRVGLILVMSLRYFPFVHFAMEQSIANMGTEFSSAARSLGASRLRTLFKVTLPLMTPALLAGGSIAFAEGFGDFGFAAAITPQTHIPFITYQIYASLNQAPVDYPSAASLSFLLILVTAGVMWLQMYWMREKSYTTVSSQAHHDVIQSGRRFTPLTGFGIVLAVVAVVLPVGATLCASLWRSWSNGIAASNWTTQFYASALAAGSDGSQALLSSFLYSLITAIVTMSFGLLLAYQMTFQRSAATRIANLITVGTIALPGLVLAASFIFAWNAVWLIPLHLVLYGTPICLGMAYVAGSLPYAIRLQLGAMRQLSPSLLTAARVLGARQGRVLSRIVLPLVGATAISTFFMTFTGTMFELAASSLLYPAGSPPFPVEIQSLFNAFEWSEGSALTIIGLVLVFGLYGVGQWIVARWSRRTTGARRVADGSRPLEASPAGVQHGRAV